MKRPSLVSELSASLLDQIVSGVYPPGGMLPSEADIAEQHEVSRVTVREATKTLAARGVVTIRSGKGIIVNPVRQWSSIESAVLHASHGVDERTVVIKLIQVRRILESGAAEHAARHRSDDDLASIRGHLEQMVAAERVGDPEGLALADLAFHDAILRASGNVFLDILYEPIRRTLRDHRLQAASSPAFRENNIRAHGRILDAIAAGDPDAARITMELHLDQASADFEEYIFSAE